MTQLCPTLCDPYGLYSPWNSPGQNTGVGGLSLLQGIFPTQGLNPGLPHCRRILYQLSYEGSPSIKSTSLIPQRCPIQVGHCSCLDLCIHHLSINCSVQFSSVAQSCPTLCDPMDWLLHARLPCPSPTPRACSNSCPLSWWCHPTISSSVVPFSSCLQSFPASGSFPMSQFSWIIVTPTNWLPHL